MSSRGNFVSEWFGHRVYPTVSESTISLSDQQSGRCPFLSQATGEDKMCVKSPAAHGICSINSASNGARQDWLICPYRALDPALVESVARRLYGAPASRAAHIVPAPTMARSADRKRFIEAVRRGDLAVLYVQDKLGGEISIAPTDRSPELSFDITMVEVHGRDEHFALGRYGIFEVQTMDFHGSYRAVVQNLKDALRLHSAAFHDTLTSNPAWLSQKIEGPNIANVFKRTFYQIVLKFQIAADGNCAGCVLALPAAVWDSWQRHLGKPDLVETPSGTFSLGPPIEQPGGTRAWIYVFDLDTQSDITPSPVIISKVIETSAEQLIHHALTVAPAAAISGSGSADRVGASILRRISQWWPEIEAPTK